MIAGIPLDRPPCSIAPQGGRNCPFQENAPQTLSFHGAAGGRARAIDPVADLTGQVCPWQLAKVTQTMFRADTVRQFLGNRDPTSLNKACCKQCDTSFIHSAPTCRTIAVETSRARRQTDNLRITRAMKIMNTIAKFDDPTIERLFGADDAENETDERFKEYFYFNKIFENIDNDLPIRILVGHKGIGKSALLRRAFLRDRERNRLAIRLQPGDLLKLKADASASELDFLAEKWKDGLLSAITEKTVTEFTKQSIDRSELQGLGRTVKDFIAFLSAKLLKKAESLATGADREIATALSQENAITVYIDDIDRGWSASDRDIRNISALLTAVRDISGSDQRIRFRIGLRTDAYYLVRTSDETTDKIERNVVWLTWTHHEVLCVVAKRITTFFWKHY